MTNYIRITTNHNELDLCECAKVELENELRNLLGTEVLKLTYLADLDAKVHNAYIISDGMGIDHLKETNTNLYPYFFVGEVVVVKKTSEGFEMFTASEIEALLDWYHGLEEQR